MKDDNGIFEPHDKHVVLLYVVVDLIIYFLISLAA